jgi:sigma-B regulation protein RsbU (phosphoserine phosphatase)
VAEAVNLEDARLVIAEQVRTMERLKFLVEASKVLNSTLDLGELLGIILKIATQHTRAGRGSLFLVDYEKKEIWSLIAHGLEEKEIRLPMGQGIAGWVAETGEMVNLEDAYADERFDRNFDKKSGYRTRSLLCVPIKNRDGKAVGVLQLLNRKEGLFGGEDIDFLESISIHSAIALENARLHRESLERQRLERELTLARKIQESLLPASIPKIEGYDIAVRYESSLQVGGDYYDLIKLNDTSLVFVVADVEGKGVASAMVMSNLQATLHALLKHVHSLQGVLYNLNDNILRGTQGHKYMTLVLGLIDLPSRTLHYINAGHVRPLVVRPSGETIELDKGGVPVGLFGDMRYERGFVKLEEGDVMLACSDGIPEAANPADVQYEDERMVKVARARLKEPAQVIVDAIFEDVEKFSEGAAGLQDDRVMMAIKVR